MGKPVIDHFWQTETGWPILTSLPGVEEMPIKYGSPSVPAYGYDLRLLRESDASEADADEKGVVAIFPPLPPGCLSTLWGDDERFVNTYFTTFSTTMVYSTFDWGIRDKDGYYFILGRTDDVINVAGHRLGTREIEEAVQSHPNIAEVVLLGLFAVHIAVALRLSNENKNARPTAYQVRNSMGRKSIGSSSMLITGLIIGAFVVGAFALVIVGLLVFGSGRFFEDTSEYVLYFEDSVTGLSRGAPVVSAKVAF